MPKTSFIDWIKTHKLTVLLILIIGVLIIKPKAQTALLEKSAISSAPMRLPATGGDGSPELVARDAAYSSNEMVAERKLVTTTSLSLKVEDVAQTIEQITDLANANQGFLVSSNLESPEEGTSGSITVRVKTEQLPVFLQATKELSLKVVSEYVSGRDITEQYTDIDERLRLLNSTKSKFETILNSATAVTDMVEVQRELLNLQTQIESLEGQLKYLNQSSDYSLVTIYLATDELALPYAPAQTWSAKTIFKQAVRSLIITSRGLANLGIWLVVYSPILIIGGGIYWLIKKKLKKS